jgi:hypothetical protein
MQIPFGPVISRLGIYPTDILAQVQNDIPAKSFIAALFVIEKYWKQTRHLSVEV